MPISGASHANVVLSLFSRMDPAGIVISVVLLIVSVYSWAVILERVLFFKLVERGFNEFEQLFGTTRDLAAVAEKARQITPSPLSRLYKRGYSLLREGAELLQAEKRSDDVERRTRSGSIEMQVDLLRQSMAISAEQEAANFDKRLAVLGTIAAACPFVGLLGTVWGIMVAFYNMGALGTAEFQVVAGGISSALMTTVAGLVAAIPALVSHNFFVHKGLRLASRIEDFNNRFQRLAGRWFVKALSGTQATDVVEPDLP